MIGLFIRGISITKAPIQTRFASLGRENYCSLMDWIPNLTGKRKRRNFGYRSTAAMYDKMRITTVSHIFT